MTTAKPQQAGSSDSADDLIAELAKLMADDAQRPVPVAKPVAASLDPRQSAPVRIPGFDPAPSAGSGNSAPRPDFGRTSPPLSVEPIIPRGVAAPQPQPAAASLRAESNPFARPQPAPGSPLPAQPTIRPVSVAPPETKPAFEPAPFKPRAFGSPEPGFAPRDSVPTVAAPTPAAPSDFNFDFGFGADDKRRREPTITPEPLVDPEARDEAIANAFAADLMPQSEPAFEDDQPVEPDAYDDGPGDDDGPRVPTDSLDPIAALIAAELDSDASNEEPARQPARNVFQPQVIPRRPAEDADSFTVAPVFGFGNKPAPKAQEPLRADPMDEIESLIGGAVRVDISAEPRPASQNPISQSLDANFPLRRANVQPVQEPPRGAMSVEDTIMAAAAATGAEVSRIDSVDRRDGDRKPGRFRKSATAEAMDEFAEAKPRRGIMQYAGLALAGVLLLAAGFGLYWVLGMTGGSPDGSTAPVLTPQAGVAVAEAPAEVAGEEDPIRSIIFEDTPADPANEALVVREEPTDAVADEPVAIAAAEEPAATDTRVITPDNPLASRQVRTVTVRPDGTIVSGDNTTAGAEVLPVDRPDVPDLPATSDDASDLLDSISGGANSEAIAAIQPSDPAANPLALTPGAASPLTTDPALTGTPVALEDVPLPLPRPNRATMVAPVATAVVNNAPAVDVPASGALDLTNSAGLAPAAQVPAAAAPVNSAISGGNAPAYVQLSSQRSEAEARAALSGLQNQFSGLFGGQGLEIQRADLGARGIYYRVVLPASSLSAANTTCNSVKNSGGDCYAYAAN